MKMVTVIFDHHGNGKLLGVLDDSVKIQELKKIVNSLNQENYIKFYDVAINEIDIEYIKAYD